MTSPDRPTVAFDHHSADFCAHNYQVMDDLRAHGSVVYSEAHGGFWVLTGYEPVAAALSDDGLFSSKPSVGIPASPLPAPLLPVETDPPLTGRLRAMIAHHLTPAAVRRLEPRIRDMTSELIDEFIERGECDIAAELTTPLPARTILTMLDFDESRWREWVDCVHLIMHDRMHDPDKTMEAAGKIFATISAEMQRRQTDGLGDDLLSSIMRGAVDGRPLDTLEISMYALVLLLAGMDTTSGLTGNALIRLDQDPALLRQLISDRGLLRTATEEFLRHDTPAQGLARTVTRNTDFFGQQLRKGDPVLMMFAAANRDPDRFDRPDEIDFDRGHNKHLAFGIGEHRCLGASLARLMFQVMLDEILTRLPDFRVTGPGMRFPDAGETYALRHLPIAFTPGSATTHDQVRRTRSGPRQADLPRSMTRRPPDDPHSPPVPPAR